MSLEKTKCKYYHSIDKNKQRTPENCLWRGNNCFKKNCPYEIKNKLNLIKNTKTTI
jgi:hypothetical protein